MSLGTDPVITSHQIEVGLVLANFICTIIQMLAAQIIQLLINIT